MNPIGWCDTTINPITGCLNGCPYCYARKMATRLKGRFGYPEDEPFRPTFHPDKLQEIYNLPKAHRRVFLDSMSDWFSPGVEEAWLDVIIGAVDRREEHTFLVLTKRPNRIIELLRTDVLSLPKNLWVGVSVACQEDVWRINWLRKSIDKHRFISFEPLHGPIKVDLSGIDWVIIGAESGNRKGKIIPDPKWVASLIGQAKAHSIPVFCKNNLDWPFAFSPKPQEFPEAML